MAIFNSYVSSPEGTENLKPTGFSLGVLEPWAFLGETPRGSLPGRLHFEHRGVARQVLDGPDAGRAGGSKLRTWGTTGLSLIPVLTIQ